MDNLSFENIKPILDEHFAKLKQDGGKAICLAAVNANGILIGLYRMDEVHDRTIQLAINKAYTAAKRETSTAYFRDYLNQEQMDIVWLGDAAYCPIPGGIPVFKDKKCIGAIGASGRHMNDDHALVFQLVESIEKMLAK